MANRINWTLEEAIALYDIYFKSDKNISIDNNTLQHLSNIMQNRAKILNIKINDKYRNITGLSMQIKCIHFIVANGKSGLSNVSKIFYDAYNLYKTEPDKFYDILKHFYEKYDISQE